MVRLFWFLRDSALHVPPETAALCSKWLGRSLTCDDAGGMPKKDKTPLKGVYGPYTVRTVEYMCGVATHFDCSFAPRGDDLLVLTFNQAILDGGGVRA